MRTAYLGTSDFAATVLELVASGGHAPALVLTRPDRPRGRGRRLGSPPVARAARALGLELYQPESVNGAEAREVMATFDPDVVCICAFGGLIKEPLLSQYQMLNVHPSLLPRWRGAAPIERAIEAGDRQTGVTIMRPTAELDAGPTCLQRAEPIRPDDDYGSLAARLARVAGELLLETLDRTAEGRPPACEEQPAEGVTYAERIGAADRRLDPSLPARVLERRVRALHPHIGAYTEVESGERLAVRRAAVPAEALPTPAAGELAATGGRLLLGAADGPLELLEVQPPGRRPMEAAAYLRGHPVGPLG